MSDMKNNPPGTTDSQQSKLDSPGDQSNNTFEAFVENGTPLRRQSNRTINQVIVIDGERLFYKDEYAIISILHTADIDNQHNFHNLPSEINNTIIQLIKIEKERKNGTDLTLHQYGCLWLIREDGKYKQYGPFRGRNKKHSEDFIFEILCKKFKHKDSHTKCKTKYTMCLIYSTNSPCLSKNKELNHLNPCMVNLILIKTMLERHNIKTYFGFSKFYGISGSCEKYLDKQHYLDAKIFTELEKKIPYKIKIRFKNKSFMLNFNKFIQQFKESSRQNIVNEYNKLFQFPLPGKTYIEFCEDGEERIKTFTQNVRAMFDNNNKKCQAKQLTDLLTFITDWRDKTVMRFFLNEINDIFKNHALMFYLDSISDIVNTDFIGCLKETNEHLQPEIQPEDVILMPEHAT